MHVFCSHVRLVIFRYSTANSCKQSNIERYSTAYHFEGVIKEHAKDVSCPVRILALFQKIRTRMKAVSWHQVSTLILSTQEIAAAARALQLLPPFESRQPQLDCVRPRLQKYFFKNISELIHICWTQWAGLLEPLSLTKSLTSCPLPSLGLIRT